MVTPDESREPDRGREAPPGGRYVPGFPQTTHPGGDTITSIAGLREAERRGRRARKDQYREAVRLARQTLKQCPPSVESLRRTRQQCRCCQIRIQRREMWRHPLRAFRSILRSWRASRAFRKEMLVGLADLERNEGGPSKTERDDMWR